MVRETHISDSMRSSWAGVKPCGMQIERSEQVEQRAAGRPGTDGASGEWPDAGSGTRCSGMISVYSATSDMMFSCVVEATCATLVGNPLDRVACKIEFTRLVEEVLSAGREARLPEARTRMIRQYDRDHRRRAARDALQQFHAGAAGQAKIRDHDIGSGGVDTGERGIG